MKYLLVLFLFQSFLFVQAQSPMPRLCQGKLDNGLTYYIKHSDLQPGKASFYLVQDVGAILENDSENGLAHFLEHMAFNGTEHFPDDLMPYLRSEGMYTFNAHTGLNETVYNLDDVPLENTRLTDTCLYILKDWCNGILLRDKDIDDERNIIIEEWRTRHTPARRLIEAAAPYAYNHSKYAERNVIGTVEQLQSFSADTLRAFYRKWYRPDLQCILIVGDIDEKAWEKKLTALFSRIPAPVDPLPRYRISIDENEQPIYGLLLEAENRSRTLTLHQRIPKTKYASEEDRRKYIFSMRFFNQLWKDRLNRLVNNNDEKFLSASVSFGSFVPEYNGMTMEIVPFDRQDSAAFEQVWTLWEQIRRFGFTDEEIKKVQETEYAQLADLQKRPKQNRNNYYVLYFKNNFLNGTPYYDLEEEVEKNIETVLEYTPEDMRNWIDSWAGNRNLSFIIAGNQPDYPYLTESQLHTILATVREKNLHQEEKKQELPALFDLRLRPGKINRTESLPVLGAEIWTLSNGAKVVYKQVKEGNGHFSLACSSYGGRSVVDAEDLPSLDAMQALVLKSGIYRFDRNTLQDILQGKNIRANLFLNEWTEGIGGNAETKQAELFFQFIYLMFEHPRFNPEQFDKFVQRQRYIYENTPRTPLKQVQDSIRHLTVLPSTRMRSLDSSYLADMDFHKIERLYRERFSNAREFTFCIVGDLSPEEARRLACQYLGALPSKKGKKENFILHDYEVKKDSVVRTFEIEMPDEKGIIDLSFENDLQLDDKEQLTFTIYGHILRNRYFRIIREEQGGAYGVDATTNYAIFPKVKASLSIHFQTNPAKTGVFRDFTLREIQRSKTQLYSPAELQQIVVLMKQEREMQETRKGIDYWMNVLNYYVEFGVDLTAPSRFEEIIDHISPEDIRTVAQKFLQGARKKDILIKSAPKRNEGSIF